MKMIALVSALSIFLGAEALAFSQDAAPAPASETPAASVSEPDQVRCRRIQVTGSLVRKTKICKTNAQWAQIDLRENAEARRMLERNLEGSSTSGR